MKVQFPLLPAIKCAAALCFPLPLLPVLAALSLPAGAPPDESGMARLLAEILGAGVVGLLCGALWTPKLRAKDGRGYRLLANLLGFGAALACAGVGFLLQAQSPGAPEGWGRWYLAGVHAAGAFAAASACGFVWEWDYGDILTNAYLLVLVGLDTACSLIFWAAGNTLPPVTLSFALLFAACVYAAARNQGNIDYLMEKRSNHSAAILPRRMRWYSFSLVGVIFLLIFAGYFLRKPVAAFFRWVLHLLKMLAAALLSLLPAGGGGEPVAEAPPEGGNGGMGLPPAEEGGGIFWTLFGVAVGVFCLWLLFLYRKNIWEALCGVARKLRGLVNALLFHGRAPSALADANQYFEDNVEELERGAGGGWKREKPYDLRRWKKEYRAFRKLPDSAGKLREGYRLSMLRLLLKGVPLTPADTPAEICRKAGDALPPELYRCVTAAYCRARYDGQAPDAAESRALEELLGQAE